MVFLSICFISSISLFFMGFLSLFLALKCLVSLESFFLEWEVFDINSVSVVMTLYFDWISLMFVSFVLFISSMVIFYSGEYMVGDDNINRFIVLVLLFVFSMILMIVSPNLISILLGWDGLGLVSYCLVIYYQNVKSYNAGMLTILSNRVGDVGLLMSVAWMFNYGSWNFIFYLDCLHSDSAMWFVGLMVGLAAFTSSAQIPFSAWLPAAMAAPTPVSSLVHSSTLVTAGVYLLIRFDIGLSDDLSFVLLFFSSLTMFMAGLGANFEFDLSKIIALSTLSQLGLMILTLCLGNYALAFFHLLMHALFKALLFMCAGYFIHGLGDNQDIRNMGGLVSFAPLPLICFNISNLSLCGMPFLSGFYSKDAIIEVSFMSNLNFFIFSLLFFSIGLTVMYSFRLCYYLFTGRFNSSCVNMLVYSGGYMIEGMLIMSVVAILGGSCISWLIFPCPYLVFLPFDLKVLTLVVSVMGMFIGYEVSKFSLGWPCYSLGSYSFSYFLGSMWFFPSLSTSMLCYFPIKSGFLLISAVDMGWNESLGGQGLYEFLINSSSFIQFIQNNNLKIYFLLFSLWTVVILFVFS
uniref:NADH-ubiquinone oxidoreductase chain 5 n=1 Tax=Tetraphalerus bruchi TaxID=546504 RepID=B6D8Z0_TETBR|nr:NADH dehydrogenase subunit 5 [Tetraphalerus bruchi]ACF35128.1 NADH dehydrogenase subunit 5 [Tetraphalerus bruchi]